MTLEELLALIARAEDAAALAAADTATVTALRAELRTAYDGVRPVVATLGSEGVAALRRVAAAITTVDTDLAARATAAAALDTDLATLDAQVAAGDAAAPDAGAGEGGDGGTDAGAGDAGAGTGEGEPPAGGGDAPDGGTGEGEPGGEGGEGGDAATQRTVAAARPSLDALAGALPAVNEPPEPETRMVASSSGFRTVAAGQPITRELLGVEMKHLANAMQTLEGRYTKADKLAGKSYPKGRKHYLGTIPINRKPGVVFGEDSAEPSLIQRAVDEHKAAKLARNAENLRVTAAGGNCTFAEPDYSVKVVGQAYTDFTDDLPTVVNNRPITYYPWFEIDNSPVFVAGHGAPDSGIGFVTEPEDRAGYGDPDADPSTVPEGGVPFKTGIHIDCPDTPLTCDVEAVFKELILGRFQATSHPEYVAAFEEYMSIFFSIARDDRALGKYIAWAVANNHVLTADSTQFGAASELPDVLRRIRAHEVSAHHDRSIQLNVVSPDWLGDYVTTDIARRTLGSVDNLRVTPQQALAIVTAEEGFSFSNYSTGGVGTTSADAQHMVLSKLTHGAVPDWPSEVRLLVYPDGAVFKKSGGELSFGLIETLIKSNDFGTFMEVFENVCFRTPRCYVLDVKLCQNGATGAPVALTCGGD